MTASPHAARAAELDRAGDLLGALAAYEAALAASPDDPDLLAALADLAERLQSPPAAAGFWRRVLAADPGRLEAVDGLARALRDAGRFDEAIEVLRPALTEHPGDGRLWNSLGVTLTQDGQAEPALTFLDEALRLDPGSAAARYNRGNALIDLGRLDEARADLAAAGRMAKRPADFAMIAFAAATAALAAGDLEVGWDAYEARLSPDMPRPTAFDVPGARWTPDMPLDGKHLLVVAEQGGAELMFASLLPDVLDALGPDGRLALAVEPRLVALMARSFPAAAVSAHATVRDGALARRGAPAVTGRVDAWVPMASLPRRFRRRITDFPQGGGALVADPARVAHWRGWLGEGPPAVGISWRSGKAGGDRRRQYPPLQAWTAVAAVPGLRFVNIQYGDCTGELEALGGQVLQPPGIDLREDIDDLAALLTALDQVVSIGNATAQLAGALDRPTLLIGAPAAWPRLGTGRFPWRPAIATLHPERFGDWDGVMRGVVERLSFRS